MTKLETIIYNYIRKNQKDGIDSVDISVGTLTRADICMEVLHSLQDAGKIIRIEGVRTRYEICDGAKCKFCLKPSLFTFNTVNEKKLSKCYYCGEMY